ncbi:hypothetical protein [Paraburkholderia pallida]|uniref:Uncharacterized protein n=1 Tax=Paraburkholderia pallida TaxID=2547399 RepID=A0A4P7D7C6_9BURK|nr:hypothetical protein [Paraburkholderia pallida]QBR04098.1 hypothetical protein E1956_43870 [Paraburkholderia pallida]
MNADVLAESRRLEFDVNNATDDGMRNAPEDGASRKVAGQQHSDTRDRRKRKDPGKFGAMTNVMDS